MSGSSDELLSKADALLSRWRGGSPQAEPPADYPLLTEEVETSASDGSRSDQLSAEQIRIIEERVQRRVLEAIEPEVAGILAGCLHSRLEDAVKRLAFEITGQVSDDIVELLHEAVHRALEREFHRLPEDDIEGER